MPTEQEMPPSASLGQTSFAETLRSRRLDQTTQSEPVLEMDTAPPNPLLARIEELVTANAEKAEDVLLARLEQLVVAVEDGQRMVAPTAASISLGMLSEEEWKALVDVYSQDKDGRAVEHVLNLMKVCQPQSLQERHNLTLVDSGPEFLFLTSCCVKLSQSMLTSET